MLRDISPLPIKQSSSHRMVEQDEKPPACLPWVAKYNVSESREGGDRS